ncbi:MAG: hypothetical protein ACTS8S_08180 [Giesbergeria sp.]
MSAPIQLQHIPRRTRTQRLRRAIGRSAWAAWLGAWVGVAMLALVAALLIVCLPFIAGVLSAAVWP